MLERLLGLLGYSKTQAYTRIIHRDFLEETRSCAAKLLAEVEVLATGPGNFRGVKGHHFRLEEGWLRIKVGPRDPHMLSMLMTREQSKLSMKRMYGED